MLVLLSPCDSEHNDTCYICCILELAKAVAAPKGRPLLLLSGCKSSVNTH